MTKEFPKKKIKKKKVVYIKSFYNLKQKMH